VNAFQVVPFGSSASLGVGLGFGALTSTATTFPSDILEQMALIASTTTFNGRLLHNNTVTTAVNFNAEANTTSVGSILATATLSGVFSDGKFNQIPINENFYFIDYGLSYYEVLATTGAIRGQLYSVVTPSHRRIPNGVDQVSGFTLAPAGSFRTLRYANQEGSENNDNSYVRLVTAATGGDFTYEGVFTFQGRTSRNNFEIVRGYTVELNLRIDGVAVWLFEIFDFTAGVYRSIGTVDSVTVWTPMYVEYFPTNVHEIATNRKNFVLRVSTLDTATSTLYLDLFAVRVWVPTSLTNQFWRFIVKTLLTLPSE
jgi:hypothetical protein